MKMFNMTNPAIDDRSTAARHSNALPHDSNGTPLETAGLEPDPESGVRHTLAARGQEPALADRTSVVRVASSAQSAASSAVDHPALVKVEETQVDPTWRGEEETLSNHEITIIVRGCQGTRQGETESTASPVEALLNHTGTTREDFSAGEVELHRLRVSFHWGGLSPDLPSRVQDSCGRLHELASWLVSERESQFPNAQNYRQGLLSALVSEYLRLSVVAASRIEEKTRTYMLKHLGDPISLEDLASNIGMSRYYFCRVYKDIAGHTPMEHLRALRLERAKDLIRSTALPLKAIAPEVGFGSAQHLCRLLHDRFGVGVRELRGVGALDRRAPGDSRQRGRSVS